MKKYILATLFVAIFGLIINAGEAAAQTKKRIQFARGASAATVRGRVSGFNYIDYLVGVRAGQTLTLRLITRGVAETVLFAPNDVNVEGGTGVTELTTVTEFSGDYKIRVLMPRAYSRRNAVSNFTLRVRVEN